MEAAWILTIWSTLSVAAVAQGKNTGCIGLVAIAEMNLRLISLDFLYFSRETEFFLNMRNDLRVFFCTVIIPGDPVTTPHGSVSLFCTTTTQTSGVQRTSTILTSRLSSEMFRIL